MKPTNSDNVTSAKSPSGDLGVSNSDNVTSAKSPLGDLGVPNSDNVTSAKSPLGDLGVHELHSQVKSFLFVVMIPVALIVSFLVTGLQVTSYKDRMQVYLEQQKQSNEQLDEICFYSQMNVDVYMPPSVLSVFAKGLDENIGNKITVSIIETPELSTTSQRNNAFIRIFNNMDISGVVKILSIFMVLMAACPIAMDRERQTGKLIFANPVGRWEYFLSKYMALMVIACIMTIVIFITPVVWMTFDPLIDLSLSELGSILLMMISGILYLSVFVLISLAVSAVSPKVSIATISSLMVWATLVFIYPFTVNSVIDRLVKIPSDSHINEQIRQIDNELDKEIEQFFIKNYINLNSRCRMGISRYGVIDYCNVTTKDCFESYKLLHDFTLPKWWNRNDQVYALKNSHKEKQLSKKKLYEQFAFFIPDNIYQNVCDRIAGTDYDFRERQFTEAAQNYRTVLMDYVRAKNGFGYAFFTQMPESEMRNTNEEYSWTVLNKYCNNENLDKIFTDEVPRFTFTHSSKPVATRPALLLLLNVVLGGLSIYMCNKFLSFK